MASEGDETKTDRLLLRMTPTARWRLDEARRLRGEDHLGPWLIRLGLREADRLKVPRSVPDEATTAPEALKPRTRRRAAK